MQFKNVAFATLLASAQAQGLPKLPSVPAVPGVPAVPDVPAVPSVPTTGVPEVDSVLEKLGKVSDAIARLTALTTASSNNPLGFPGSVVGILGSFGDVSSALAIVSGAIPGLDQVDALPVADENIVCAALTKVTTQKAALATAINAAVAKFPVVGGPVKAALDAVSGILGTVVAGVLAVAPDCTLPVNPGTLVPGLPSVTVPIAPAVTGI